MKNAASPKRYWTSEDLDLVELRMQEQARRSFWAFRQYMWPEMVLGWWQKEVSFELMQFHADLLAGDRPRLLIQAPPQHGKSRQIVDFIAWLSGHNPKLKTIYASVSDRLGVRANLELQRMFDGRKYNAVFPSTKISQRNSVTVSGQKLRNRDILEFLGHDGYFRNVTINGVVNGEALDLGVIDDPIKDRKEANSITIRNSTYDWLTDVFLPRFSKDAGLLGIMTRWHIDDPFGRLLEDMEGLKVLRYPAIAEKDGTSRNAGEALFPEHKPLDFLIDQKKVMASASWEALYQQNPVMVGGGLFKDEWWGYYTVAPRTVWRTIFADTAQKTKSQHDYSVFQCWGRGVNGQAILLDQVRGKWEAPQLRQQARAFWAKHKAVTDMGTLRAMKVEDKSSGTGLIQELKHEGIPIVGIQRGIDKVTRAMDATPFIQSGNVLLPQEAPWLSDFIAEHSAFPSGSNDDQVDPMMDAVKEILSTTATPNIRAL